MPANLNALIRYRTIDQCLSNPYRKWSIDDLKEACTKALEESRGIYTGISERTIREDIRVMRSDILGFNAPIEQKDGSYFYEDRDYSIFNVSIRETDLLTRVLDFIREIQTEIQHPDMEDLIKRVSLALSQQREYEEQKEHKGFRKAAPEEEIHRTIISSRLSAPSEPGQYSEEAEEFGLEESKMMESAFMNWTLILNLI